jgi:hypothetical protein
MDKWITRLDIYGRAVWASKLCEESLELIPGMVSVEEHTRRLLEPGEGLAGYGNCLPILKNFRVVGFIELTALPRVRIS